MSYIEELNEINTQYYNSVSTGELWKSSERLYKLISGEALTKENQERGESLYLRLIVKLRFLEYLKGFKLSVYEILTSYIDEEIAVAEQKGYKKSQTVMDAARRLLFAVNGKITRINEINAALSDGGETVAKSALAALEKIENSVSDMTCDSPFGEGVEFPDVQKRILSYVSEVKQKAEGILTSKYERLAKEYLKAVDDVYALAEYYPSPEYDEGGKANAMVLSTPFYDEALLYGTHDIEDGQKLYILDGEVANSLAASVISKIIEIAANLKRSFMVKNVNSLSGDKQTELFFAVMRAGKAGIKAYIHDSAGDDGVYQKCLKLAIENGFSSSDISRAYVSMPSFNDVFRELESKNMLTVADIDRLKEMPFMGFKGLNKVVSAFISGLDWMRSGKKLSLYNEAEALAYLRNLSASYLFIDSGWGDFTINNKKQTEIDGFDYDGIKEIDRENVRRIVESDASVFAKCGMITRYCTLGGSDITEWEKIDRDEMTERVTLATKLVFRIMKIEQVPEVAVLDELENPTAGGLCCDGGKRILYKYSCCLNWRWMVDCIVHESFHAMQSKLTGGGWSEWYFKNFGITRGRVERWTISRKIYDGNTNSKVYKVHMYENDANAFELDCDDGRNLEWGNLDLQ